MSKNFETQDVEYLKSLAHEIDSEHLRLIISKIENLLNQLNECPCEQLNLWSGQLMYKHVAFQQPRFIDLGTVTAYTKSEAHKLCMYRAEEMLFEEFKEQDMDRLLEHWEVRVRPAMN